MVRDARVVPDVCHATRRASTERVRGEKMRSRKWGCGGCPFPTIENAGTGATVRPSSLHLAVVLSELGKLLEAGARADHHEVIALVDRRRAVRSEARRLAVTS